MGRWGGQVVTPPQRYRSAGALVGMETLLRLSVCLLKFLSGKALQNHL